MRRLVALLVLVPLAAACGGKTGPRVHFEGPIGKGADQYWLYRPTGETRALVVGELIKCAGQNRPHRRCLILGRSRIAAFRNSVRFCCCKAYAAGAAYYSLAR